MLRPNDLQMQRELLNITMHDGSRNFGDLPESVFFDKLRDHAAAFEKATVTRFVTDWVTEVWLDLEYCGHRFSINNQMGDYWFFVADASCPDAVLCDVLEHFAALLEK